MATKAKAPKSLVVDHEPEKIYGLLKSHVEANTPRGGTAKVQQLPGKANPFVVPLGYNLSEIVRSVLQKLYDKEPYEIKLGGSISVMSVLFEEVGVHATMFAFGLDDEQIHAPNEFFQLQSFEKAQKSILYAFGGIQDLDQLLKVELSHR